MPFVQGKFDEDYVGIHFKDDEAAVPDLEFPPVESQDSSFVPDMTFPSVQSAPTGITDLTFPSFDEGGPVVQPPESAKGAKGSKAAKSAKGAKDADESKRVGVLSHIHGWFK